MIYLIHLFTHYYPFIAMFISIILFSIYRNKYFILLLFGIILTGYFNHLLKHLFKNYLHIDLFNRPYYNTLCDPFNNSNNISYGFPSGHVQTAGFISIFLWLYCKKMNILSDTIKLILILLPLLVIYGRIYVSKCHNIIQTIGGLLIGLYTGYIYFEIIEKINI